MRRTGHFVHSLAVPLALLALLLGACGSDDVKLGTLTDCKSCLAHQGTWQPGANGCTPDCDLQDVACFRDQCPAACSDTSCSTCYSEAACRAASCNWMQADEVTTCVAPDTQASDCETCLRGGGTWQPETNACTVGCSIADATCFSDACP